jgi:hypothetical protein
MRPILLGHTLDLDSTVFCRYGEQAGMRLRYIKPRCPEQNVRSEDSPLSLLIDGEAYKAYTVVYYSQKNPLLRC